MPRRFLISCVEEQHWQRPIIRPRGSRSVAFFLFHAHGSQARGASGRPNAGAVGRVDQKLAAQNVAILSAVDKRLEKLEERWLEKFNKLNTTLDKFLKRMTDMEEEFVFMKNDVNRIKAVLREKLGVALD